MAVFWTDEAIACAAGGGEGAAASGSPARLATTKAKARGLKTNALAMAVSFPSCMKAELLPWLVLCPSPSLIRKSPVELVPVPHTRARASAVARCRPRPLDFGASRRGVVRGGQPKLRVGAKLDRTRVAEGQGNAGVSGG